MKQIYTNAPSGNARITDRTLSITTCAAKGKKIIVDIIGPRKGKK